MGGYIAALLPRTAHLHSFVHGRQSSRRNPCHSQSCWTFSVLSPQHCHPTWTGHGGFHSRPGSQ